MLIDSPFPGSEPVLPGPALVRNLAFPTGGQQLENLLSSPLSPCQELLTLYVRPAGSGQAFLVAQAGWGADAAQAAKRRMYTHMITLLLIVAIITAVAFFLLRGRQTVAQSSAPQATKESVAAPGAKAGFDRLKGRWLRPDGSYVLEIREIDGSGKMAAAYFNPRPINVSRAEASQEGATTKVFIELRDKNYPGSTYTLTYDPGNDQLKGTYF